ncbi:hypothetical protein DL93DRAFT_2086697, partial [Clavulina sp. PMI_390]
MIEDVKAFTFLGPDLLHLLDLALNGITIEFVLVGFVPAKMLRHLRQNEESIGSREEANLPAEQFELVFDLVLGGATINSIRPVLRTCLVRKRDRCRAGEYTNNTERAHHIELLL